MTRPRREITARQREVLGLIAIGLTNKEMAHSLGISERGAAAHVSRLLARYRVPNRAGLIARTLSDAIPVNSGDGGPVGNTSINLPVAMQREFDAYRSSPFMIGLTVGPENVLAYVNEAGRSFVRIGPQASTSKPFAIRR